MITECPKNTWGELDLPAGEPFDGNLIGLPGKRFVVVHCEHAPGRASCRNCCLEGLSACNSICCTRGDRADKCGARVDIL